MAQVGCSLPQEGPIISGASFLFSLFLWGLPVSMATASGASLLAGALGAGPSQLGLAGVLAQGRAALTRPRKASAPGGVTGPPEEGRARGLCSLSPQPGPSVEASSGSRYGGQTGSGVLLWGCSRWLALIEWGQHSSPLTEPQFPCGRWLQASLRTVCLFSFVLWDVGREGDVVSQDPPEGQSCTLEVIATRPFH